MNTLESNGVMFNPLINIDGANHRTLVLEGGVPLQNLGRMADFNGEVEFALDKISVERLDEEHLKSIICFQMALWQESNPEVNLFVLCELGKGSDVYFLLPAKLEEEGYTINQHGLHSVRENLKAPTVGMAFGVIGYNLYAWYVYSKDQQKGNDGKVAMPVFELFETFRDNAFQVLGDSDEGEVLAWAID